MRILFLTLALLPLAACNETPVEAKQSESQLACFRKAEQLFPELAKFDAPEADQNVSADADDNTSESYRIVSTGQFTTEFVIRSGSDIPTMKLGCTGDFNAGRLTSLTYNGTIKRPAPGEVWSF